jgi:DNA-directed RNA polymerase subunit RPC12/RpoP
MLEAELGEPDDLRCPHCGSKRFLSRRSYPEVALLLIGLVLGGTIFPLRSCVHRCDDCGAKWNDNVRMLFLWPRPAP